MAALEELQAASLAASTRKQYQRSWEKFQKFATLVGVPVTLPLSIPITMWFIAYLHGSGMSGSSVVTTMSAISYFHKMGFHTDPTKNFFISKLLVGAKNLHAAHDVRLPITAAILESLLRASFQVIPSQFCRMAVCAVMVLAFKGFFRIGELLPRLQNAGSSVVQFADVLLIQDRATVTVRKFKHSSSKGPQVVHVCLAPANFAAVLHQYFKARGNSSGPFFISSNGSLLLRAQFDKYLKSLLMFCGFSTSAFKGHSFRIGAATAAAARGESDAQIRAAGRWSSDAFRKYIRITQ